VTERDKQFTEAYRAHRFEDQRTFYHSRRSEFEAARDQSSWLTSFLMILTGAASALASAPELGGPKWLWSILAIALPAVATALFAYSSLYGFERQGKIYGDAENALICARADAPDLKPPMDDTAFHQAMGAHVQQVEQILSAEQAQWGQLIGEIKPMPAPQATSSKPSAAHSGQLSKRPPQLLESSDDPD
jgi:SMODS and SLOG-associating 2TM effector domain 1